MIDLTPTLTLPVKGEGTLEIGFFLKNPLSPGACR